MDVLYANKPCAIIRPIPFQEKYDYSIYKDQNIISEYRDLEEFIRDNIEGINELILDFKELDYVSSAGLRVLLVTLKLMKTKGSIKIINVNESVNEVLTMTGFANIIKIERA